MGYALAAALLTATVAQAQSDRFGGHYAGQGQAALSAADAGAPEIREISGG